MPENEAIVAPHETHTQVIGYGAAALGIPVAADRLERLEMLARTGIVFLERNGADAFSSLRYKIVSNSPARDFLDTIRPDGLFRDVLRSDPGRAIRAAGEQPIELDLVFQLLRRMAAVVAEYLQAAAPVSGVLFRQTVDRIERDAYGYFTTFDPDGRPLVRSRNLVLAPGAHEKVDRARELSSARVLRGADDDALSAAIEAGRPILIQGGSHSAFSVAEYLVRTFSRRLSPAQIIVCHRDRIKLYYRTVLKAVQDGVDLSQEHVEPGTGEVNKFDGLRGVAKELYQRVVAGDERSVGLRRLEDLGPELADSAAVRIAARGYSPRTIPLHGPSGEAIQLTSDDGALTVTTDSRIVDDMGTPIPRLFAIGLGHAVPSPSGPKVGVNHFHGQAGENIVRGVLDKAHMNTYGVATLSVAR